MKREDLTADAVAHAVASIREAEQGAAPGVYRVCLQELADLQGRLEGGETPDLDDYPEGLAALDFVVQLRKSSLSTPAAKSLSERTDSDALGRIAWHRQEHSDGADDPFADPASLYSGRGWSVRMTNEAEGPEVICLILLRLVVSDEASLPLPVEGRYNPTDPYAVELLFHTEEEHVTWVVGRETIAAGLRTYAGAGDVKVWPRVDCDETTCIALQSPEGTALLEGPTAAFQTFLRRTNDLVSPGAESQHIHFDASFDMAAFEAKRRQSSNDQ